MAVACTDLFNIMATVHITVRDVEGQTKQVDVAVVCEPPIESGKLPETPAGQCAERILGAMITYLKTYGHK